MARARKAKSSSVKVNFKGVESRRTPPEGDYVAKVLEAEAGPSGSGNDQIKWTLEISRGEFKGTKLWFYTPLVENSLWKLHAWLTALGEDVPEDEVDVDLPEMVDKELVVVLGHETYQGKKQAKIGDFQSLEDYEGDADLDEDDDKKSSKKSSKKGPEPVLAADVEAMDREELEELIESHGLDVDADDKKLKKDDKLLAAVLAALEEEDLIAEPPAKGKGKKPKKYDREEVEDMDEDDLQKIIDEHDLDVDLDDFKKLPKKAAAVIAALDEEDLLD